MRILQLVHQYMPEHIGGTELYTQALAKQLQSNACDVAIVVPASQNTGPASQVASEVGGRVYRLPAGPRSATAIFLDPLRGHTRLEAEWQTILAQEKPDLVHIQHMMGIPIAFVRHLVKRHLPYVVTLHDYFYGCANAQLFTNDHQENCRGPIGYRNCARCILARSGYQMNALSGTVIAPLIAPLPAWRARQLRFVLDHAAAVIAPTQFVKDSYAHMGLQGGQYTIIRHGIDLPSALIAEAKAARTSLSPKRGLQVVYVGGIAPQKGILTLIDAFNGLATNAQLDIYGSLDAFPAYTEQIQAAVRHPGIRFHGRVAHDDVWRIFATADVAALPTHWYEASPLTIDEIFAVGTPIIASDLGAMSEKIDHGQDGLLVPPANVAAWRQQLQLLAAQPQLLADLRAQIRPVRSMQAHTHDIVSLYHQVINNGS